MKSANITIVTCVYNGSKFINSYAENIKSVREALNFDLIIINDGSEDNTSQLLREHLPWAQIIEQNNQGLPASRNIAMGHVKTKYLLFLDIDDELKPSSLEKHLNRLMSKSSLDYTYSAPIYFKDNNLRTLKCFNLLKFATMFAHKKTTIYKRNYIVTLGNVVFRTSFLRDNHLKFSEKLTIGEDWAFLIACAQHGNSEFNVHRFLKYRLNETSMSSIELVKNSKLSLLHEEIKSIIDPKYLKLFEDSWHVTTQLSKLSKKIPKTPFAEIITTHAVLYLKNPKQPYIIGSMLKNILKKFL